MSGLYHSEKGYVLPTLCEELTHYRRGRKVLHLPGTGEPTTRCVLARAWPDSAYPLRISVNGTEVPGFIADTRFDNHTWYKVTVTPTLSRSSPSSC